MNADALAFLDGGQHTAIHALAQIGVAVRFARGDRFLSLDSVRFRFLSLGSRFVLLRFDLLRLVLNRFCLFCSLLNRFSLLRLGHRLDHFFDLDLVQLTCEIDHIIAHKAGHSLIVNRQLIPDLAALILERIVNGHSFALLHSLLDLTIRGSALAQIRITVYLAPANFRHGGRFGCGRRSGFRRRRRGGRRGRRRGRRRRIGQNDRQRRRCRLSRRRGRRLGSRLLRRHSRSLLNGRKDDRRRGSGLLRGNGRLLALRQRLRIGRLPQKAHGKKRQQHNQQKRNHRSSNLTDDRREESSASIAHFFFALFEIFFIICIRFVVGIDIGILICIRRIVFRFVFICLIHLVIRTDALGLLQIILRLASLGHA